MSRYSGTEHWIWVVAAAGLGLCTAALAESYKLSGNATKVAAYSVALFVCLACALRPAWGQARMWIDLATVLLMHVAVCVPLINFLDSNQVRLNWALSLPFIAVELLVLLGAIWRRNVGRTSS